MENSGHDGPSANSYYEPQSNFDSNHMMDIRPTAFDPGYSLISTLPRSLCYRPSVVISKMLFFQNEC